MSYRTTEALVRGIIETDDTNIPDLTPFIAASNELVTECCSDSSYDATRLEMIERWLAAHFYAIRDPRAASEKAGSVSANYQYKVDLNLAVTTYGQMAMILDTAGSLAALNIRTAKGLKKVVALTWLGTDYTEAAEDET